MYQNKEKEKEMTISEIQALTYEEAKKLAIEELTIKEHDCVIAKLGEYFGYSVLVFKNGKHIYYANDYELHHSYTVKEKGIEGLREYYIKLLNNKLYTEEELMGPATSYAEYESKRYFLQNYWIMRFEHESIFGKGEDISKKRFPFYNRVCFCYVADEKIIKESKNYYAHLLSELKKIKDNSEEFRKMIRYELDNHEAGYTGRYDDALDSLGLSFECLTAEQQVIVAEELDDAMKRS